MKGDNYKRAYLCKILVNKTSDLEFISSVYLSDLQFTISESILD
jgi:hypothetical protein